MYAVARHDNAPSLISPRGVRPAGFTSLETRVLRLAASGSEQPSTSVEPALRRLGRAVGNIVLARRGSRELADPRLEALRSYAASVRLGRTDGLAIFHAAGYTAAQARTVKAFIASAAQAERRQPRRDRIMYVSGISIAVASIAGFIGLTGRCSQRTSVSFRRHN